MPASATARTIDPLDRLSHAALRDLVARIRLQLFTTHGEGTEWDPMAQWDGDTIENIHALVEEAGLAPTACGQVSEGWPVEEGSVPASAEPASAAPATGGQYRHDFDLVCCLTSPSENPDDLPGEAVIAAMQARLTAVQANPAEWREAFGHVNTEPEIAL